MFPGGGHPAGFPTTAGFAPVTNSYGSGTGATETVPTGATSVTIRVVGGGGSGAKDSSGVGVPGGGGSGAYGTQTIAVVGGNTFTYTVGAGGVAVASDPADGFNGGDSTVSGTVSGGSVAITAGKGFKGQVPDGMDGEGGTCTGATTDIPGNPGVFGAGGASVYGGYGAGGRNQTSWGSSTAGGAGRVIFEYT